MKTFFIQPFDIDYQKYKRYIYLAVDGNRIFKEFHIITDMKLDGKIIITVIAVRHDKKVITYINDEDEYKFLKSRVKVDAIFYSEIKLLGNENRNIQYLKLFFRTEKNVNIEIELFSFRKPYRKKHAIKVNESFFQNSQNTLFYTSRRLKIMNKSTVNITGKTYNIRKKRILHFIQGKPMLNHVQDLGMVNIYNKEKRLKIIHLPEEIKEGEKFIYEIDGKEVTYLLEKSVDDNIFISCGSQKLIAKKTDKGLELFKIFVNMHTEAPEITFYPPIPMYEQGECIHSVHKASFTMGKSSVIGEANYYSYPNKGFEITYICPPFDWMQEKPFTASLEIHKDGSFNLRSGIYNNIHLLKDEN